MNDLRTMLADLVALQTLASAGSLRSAHRDPRDAAGRTTGARKEPDVLPIEGAHDSGALGRAVRSSRILARVPYARHEVLLWLADRAHGAPTLPWSWLIAQALAPMRLRAAVVATDARSTHARGVREQLRAALARGSKRITAETLRTAAQVHAAHAKADAEASTARGEYDAACRALDAWGQHELDAAVRAWFAARASVLGHDAETEAVA